MPIIVTLSDTAVSALTIIKRAMRLCGQLGAGESPSSDETADGLEALNALLDSWRNEKLMTYAMQEESLTLSSGDSSYTIGSAGDLNTTRPVAIEAAYVSSSGLNTPVEIIDAIQWARISARTTASDFATHVYYAPTVPVGTLYVYPVPNQTATMYLVTRVPLIAFATSATETYLAPGWKEALQTNLALSLAAEYERAASSDVVRMAKESKSNIKRANSAPIIASSGLVGLVGHNNRVNIETGE